MDFLAFDFETADCHQSAPCSLGIALVENNVIVYSKEYLINPECDFDAVHIAIHGITPEMVFDAPKFSDLWKDLEDLFSSYPVVAHNISFDLAILEKAAQRYGIDLPRMECYCTNRIAKNNYSLASYKLDSLCETFNISLARHHSAENDSRACAELMLYMLSDPDTRIFQYEPNVSTSSHARSYPMSVKSQYPDVLFNSESIEIKGSVFACTGSVDGYDRESLAEKIKARGGILCPSVKRTTDYLIVGIKDTPYSRRVKGKTAKLIKAEEQRESGGKVKIITAEAFLKALSDTPVIPAEENLYLELMKTLGLTSKRDIIPKKIYYKGIYSDKTVECTIVSLVSTSPAVVRVAIQDEEFDIALDYLKEMQSNLANEESRATAL